LKIFGYTKDELIGQSIYSLMSEERTANYNRQMSEVISGKIVSNIESGEDLQGKRKNGEMFPIELTYMSSKLGIEKYFISQIRDISDRKRREKELSVVSNALKIITEANRILIRAGSEKEYIQGICDVITRIGGYSKSHILYVEETLDDKILNPIAFSGDENFNPVMTSFKISSIKYSGSPTIISIKEKKTDVCRNIKARGLWKYWKKSPEEMEFDSTISVPILDHNDVIGILRVYSFDPFSFDTHEVELLEELASDISHGIKVLRERKELETSTLALKVITETNRLLVNEQSESIYLQSVCDIITGIGGFPRAGLIIAQDCGEENDINLNMAAYSGYKTPVTGKALSFKLSSIINSGSPTVTAIKEKKTDVCENIIGRGLWRYWEDSPEKMEFDSTISIPLIIQDKAIGILRVFSADPFYFDQPKIELLEELAKDISHGLHFIRTRAAHDRAVKALEESENKYRSLFQSSNDAVIIADAETGIILDANNKTEDILSASLNDIIGSHHTEIHPEGYVDKYRKLINKLTETGDTFSDEFLLRTRHTAGKAIPVQANASLISLNGKKVIQIIFRDISAMKQEEENIRKIQKMEALGTLSGGIAHDINNILSPVIGFTQLAILEKENSEKQISYLNEVLTASNRAKEIVGQILTFCRKSESDKKPHRIQSLVKEVVKLISVSVPPNVSLKTVIDENCAPILCDPIQIYQIVINLCTNAYQAMKETGGELKVCLVKKGSQEIKAESGEKLPFDDYISLIVSDTGCGMSKTILERIFEPYFTTKPKEEGSGLGLSVVSGIVREHGAEIYVRTYPNEGSYFRISFPIAAHSADEADISNKIVKTGKRLHAMVVDDEPQITLMMKLMLNELGYTADTFNDPLIALEEFNRSSEKYDFIITDQTMPHLSGTELSISLLSINPDLPIILNTGYSPATSRSECKKIGIKEFVMKPITIAELSAVVSKAVKTPVKKLN
jgi:PAS domain S-box-containing protein